MAQKRESDTLKQQRIARQDFLNLKKMQNGEMDAGPKPSEIYQKPKTLGEKLKNLWYHDKPFILIGVALVTALAIIITQYATKTKYDVTVVVFTYNITGDVNCKKMGEFLTPYCEDVNGDSEININVINCSIYDTSAEMDNTDAVENKSEHNFKRKTTVQTMLSSNASALLFITDENSFNDMQGFSNSGELFVDEPIKFGEDFYKACADESGTFDLPEGLQISCRRIKDTTIEKDKNIETYKKTADSIINELKEHYSK